MFSYVWNSLPMLQFEISKVIQLSVRSHLFSFAFSSSLLSHVFASDVFEYRMFKTKAKANATTFCHRGRGQSSSTPSLVFTDIAMHSRPCDYKIYCIVLYCMRNDQKSQMWSVSGHRVQMRAMSQKYTTATNCQ